MNPKSPPDHRNLLQQALDAVETMKAKVRTLESGATGAIAIIGAGCRLPGKVRNPAEFWDLLKEGRNAVAKVPASRWGSQSAYEGAEWNAGLVDGLGEFEPQFFNMSAREARTMDPQQRLVLEVAWEAIENAGLAPKDLAGSRTGVFVGITAMEYSNLVQASSGQDLDVYTASGNAHNATPGRVSYMLGLHGPSLAVDAACSSSLVTVHLACQSLRTGESNLALAGGVNMVLAPEPFFCFTNWGMLAADGYCKTFDARADGFVRGEGCGMVVLKRLADAQADGDNILAVIRGTAVNQDGRSSGVTVPNGVAQEAVIRQALANAGVKPHEIGYIEAHGTGTALGDPIEAHALAAVLGTGRAKDNPLVLGAVKTNLGHLEAAAGVTGLIKVALSMQHEEIPRNLHFREMNPRIDWGEMRVEVPTASRPWPRGEKPRLAGVSAFGFSGTNAHVIVEEAPVPVKPVRTMERPLHLLALSARSESALATLRTEYVDQLTAGPAELGDVCFTANAGRAHFEYRLAVSASSSDEIIAKLRGANPSRKGPEREGPRVAFLFSGQGSQYAGMGKQLWETQPVFRRAIEECADLLKNEMAEPLLQVLWGNATDRLEQTAYTQPCLFAIEYALAELWKSWGVKPSAVLGHSVGEYVAACVAGVYSLADGLKLIAARGRLMQAVSGEGAMTAIAAGEEQVRTALRGLEQRISIAAFNAPESLVIAGYKNEIQIAEERLKSAGIRVTRLAVSHGFHSPQMREMEDEFEAIARGVKFNSPRIPLISSVTGRLVGREELSDSGYWRRQVAQPVRFRDAIEALKAEGYTVFLEAGPGTTLMGLGRQCLPGDDRHWLPSLKPNRPEWEQILESLGRLYVRGAEIDWTGFDRPYHRRRVPLPTYPFERQRYWVDPPQNRPALAPAKAPHPLLWRQLQSPAIQGTVFESELSTSAVPYLADHRVYGAAILPMAAYLEMALAAGRQAGLEGTALKDVIIERRLEIAEQSKEPVQLIVGETDGGPADWQVYAREDGQWKRYARGRLGSAALSPKHESLETMRTQTPESFSVEEYYARAGALGVEFGPSFRVLQAIWRGPGCALAHVKLKENAGTYRIHPALLDGCLQPYGVALDSTAIYLPAGVDRFDFSENAGDELWTFIRVREQTEHAASLDVQVFDPHGTMVGYFEGLHLLRVEPPSNVLKDALHEFQWQPEARTERAVIQPSVVARTVRPQFERLWVEHDLDSMHAFRKDIDQFCLAAIAQALSELGWNYRVGDRFSSQTIKAELKIVDRHEKLLTRILRMLAEDGILQANGNGQYEVHRPLPERDVAGLAAALLTKHPIYQTESQITSRCVAQLSAVLAGNCDPLPLVFNAGSPEEAAKLYRDSPASKVFNSTLREGVAEVLRQWPQKEHLRILEIGSGTGGTTAYVLPMLPADTSEYWFTDISPRFTDRAETVFGQYKFLRPQPLDIERDPSEQGFPAHAFDLILASNVLHATADLRETMRHVKDLLAPEGMVLFLETTVPERWLDLTFGLLDGWWRFRDTDLRPDYPLLNESQWAGLLVDCGFAEPEWVGRDGEALFIARVPAEKSLSRKWLILSGKNEIALQVAQQLTAKGEVCTLADSMEQCAALAKLESFDGVLDLRAMEDGAPDTVDPDRIPKQSSDVAQWAQMLAECEQPPQLWLVTRGAQAVNGNSEIALANTALWGLGRTIALEQPGLRCKRIDLDPKTTNEPFADLIAEVAQQDDEDQIAYRDGVRHRLRLARSKSAPQNEDRSVHFRADSAYLITGGLRGLGLTVAEWMVQNGARRLVLLGRQAANDEASAVIDRLTQAGATVWARQADVGRYDDLAGVIREINSGFGPLAGIIHAAGVLSDAVLQQQDEARMRCVMAPKVSGAWYLHQLTADAPLDFFVLFSSLASVLGSKGQANHAAANAFMDGLAHWRRARGMAATSIQWGAWSDVGAAASPELRKLLKSKGIGEMTPAQGLELLSEAMRRNAVEIAAGPMDWNTFLREIAGGRAPWLAELTTAVVSRTQNAAKAIASGETTPQARQIAEAAPEQRKALLLALVRKQAAKVLGLEPGAVDVHRPLNECGLDSLMSLELRNKLVAASGITIPTSLLFNYPSIEEVASHLEKMLSAPAESKTIDTLQPAKSTIAASEGALSYGQQALWFLYKFNPDSAAYNISIAGVARPVIALIEFQRAFAKVVERHAALRTAFGANQQGQPVQRAAAQLPSPVVIDAGNWTDQELREKVAAEHQRPFDLERSAVRLSIFRRASEDLILFNVHHLVFDFWSGRVFMQDLRQAYAAELHQAEADFAPIVAEYRDFVEWQNAFVNQPEAGELWNFWKERLSGELPLLKLRNVDNVGRAASGAITLRFDTPFIGQVKAFAASNKTSEYVVLLAAFQVLLHRFSGQRDIIVGSPVSGRTDPRWADVLGYFVNMLPLRAQLSGEVTFAAHLQQTREQVLSGFAHQEFPFPLMVERLRLRGQRGQAPVFQASFNLLTDRSRNLDEELGVAFGSSTLSPYPLSQMEGQFGVSLELTERDGKLTGTLKSEAEMADPATAAAMAEAYLAILREVVVRPETAIENLPIGPVKFTREREEIVF